MENKEYLNEKKFQKNNKKVKIAGRLLILIGLSMLAVGIFTIVKFATQNSPKALIGGPLIVFGFFITNVGLMLRFFIGNARGISAYMAQQQIPVVKEEVEEMSPTMGNAAKEIAKGVKEGLSDDSAIYCKYCGAKLDEDSKFCSKCGKQL